MNKKVLDPSFPRLSLPWVRLRFLSNLRRVSWQGSPKRSLRRKRRSSRRNNSKLWKRKRKSKKMNQMLYLIFQLSSKNIKLDWKKIAKLLRIKMKISRWQLSKLTKRKSKRKRRARKSARKIKRRVKRSLRRIMNSLVVLQIKNRNHRVTQSRPRKRKWGFRQWKMQF